MSNSITNLWEYNDTCQHPGSRQRQDMGTWILWSVKMKNRPYTGPVLLRQGGPGTSQYIGGLLKFVLRREVSLISSIRAVCQHFLKNHLANFGALKNLQFAIHMKFNQTLDTTGHQTALLDEKWEWNTQDCTGMVFSGLVLFGMDNQYHFVI